jgi:hypothetical protein
MLEYPPVINTFNYLNKTPSVAFYGPMCSGKTYAATNVYNYFSKMSLARPLKTLAKDFYGVEGKTNEERKILQELADDLKKWDRDLFTKLFLNEMIRYLATGGSRPIVVDDVRYVYEAEDLRRYGFKIVRVYVPEHIRQVRIAEKYPDTDPARFEHPTEKDWKNIEPDFTVLGEGTEPLDNLREILLRA